MRRGFGLAGIGTALRLEFAGPQRMVDAASAWRSIASAARVTDPLQLPGTGLVALGAFTFSLHSALTSVLIVPSIIIGRSARQSWITRISVAGADERPTSNAAGIARPLGDGFRVAFGTGTLPAAGYREVVESAVRDIHDGKLSKIVLARDLTGQLPDDADLRVVVGRLALGYPDCWTFAIDGFLGSSPETLVGVSGGTVTARVLAGSAARGTDAASDQDAATALATSAKDLDEHRFAVESVLASLRPHSAAVTANELPFTLKLPNLWHLASDVEGDVTDGSTALDLVGALHPTAAVAGTPTAVALDLIDELEPFDRGRYAGPVGWVGAGGDGEWAVAVRSAQVSPTGVVTAYAGAGIVADSVPERELVETRLKFRPIVDAFG
ncbi:MAG: chorismate-binding protein [Burkholderiaceae bacterium]|nr:chorismate-binding protein [Microbacteriaceae bacterium]